MNRALSFCLIALLAAASLADAQDKKLIPVTLALLWYPQPEDGQFFAAKADGIYEKHGLDVTIRPGGAPTGGPRSRERPWPTARAAACTR